MLLLHQEAQVTGRTDVGTGWYQCANNSAVLGQEHGQGLKGPLIPLFHQVQVTEDLCFTLPLTSWRGG